MLRPRRGPCLALALSLAASAAAQEVVFDPREHLAGFAECAAGDYADAYDLRAFQAERGKRVSAARLEELRVLWNAARERGDARRQKIEADPAQAALFRSERKMRKDPFFGGLRWSVEDAHLPFAFLLQETGADAARGRALVARLLPWLEATVARLRADVFAPAGVDAATAIRCMPVMVLASAGNFADLGRIHLGSGYYLGPARWVQAFDVLAVPAGLDAGKDGAANLRFVQMELAISLLHKAAQGTRGLRPMFLLAGLAGYGAQAAVPNAGVPAISDLPDSVAVVVGALTTPALQGHAATLADLARIDDRRFDLVEEAAVQRGGGETRAGARDDHAHAVFFAQAKLWTHYLLLHRRAAFDRCLAAAFAGGTGRDSLAAGFPAAELPALEAAFAKWLLAEHRRLHPGLPQPATLPVPRPLPAEAGTESASAPAAAVPAAAPAVDAGPIALSPDEWEIPLAAALERARAGALQGAARLLASVATPGDAAAARVARERARLQALVQERQKLFAAHVASRKPLDIALGAERLRARVEAADEERVTLRAGKEAKTFALDDLAPAQLDLAARRGGQFDAKAWQSAYLQFLADGNADKARKKLAAGDAAAQELAAALEGHAALAALAPLAGRLLRATAEGAPPAAALAALHELVREHGAHPAVGSRRERLRARAGKLLATVFDPKDGACLGITGKVEWPAEGRIRITWDGSDARHAQDFTAAPRYMEDWHIEGLDSDAPPTITAVGGAFQLQGRGALRLPPLSIGVPLRVAWQGAWPERGLFMVGVCDDGAGRCILGYLHGGIAVSDEAEHDFSGSAGQLYADRTYAVTLDHDGRTASTTLDGKRAMSMPATNRTHGEVFLMLFARSACTLHKLVVEGVFDPSRVPALRERFVERRLREIFG